MYIFTEEDSGHAEIVLQLFKLKSTFFLSEEVNKLPLWCKNNSKCTGRICQCIIMNGAQSWNAIRQNPTNIASCMKTALLTIL